MKHTGFRKSRHLPLPVKILIVAAVSLILAFLIIYLSALALIRGRDSSFREKLCGTFAENGYFFTDWFFTTGEIKAATEYAPPAEVEGDRNPDRGEDLLSGFSVKQDETGRTVISGDGFTATVYEVESSSVSVLKSADVTDKSGLCIGLCEYPEMVFRNNCLFYTGEGGEKEYCFCGINAEGVMKIGAMTAREAADGGFAVGISCERILVNGGTPCSDLGGGYATRAAIGQRDDGSMFILVAEAGGGMFTYPDGISYDTLAYLMYACGARTAGALPVSGEITENSETVAGSRGTAGYILKVKLFEGGKE